MYHLIYHETKINNITNIYNTELSRDYAKITKNILIHTQTYAFFFLTFILVQKLQCNGNVYPLYLSFHEVILQFNGYSAQYIFYICI